MTGPWDELRTTGRLGPQGVELLYRTVRQVVRARNLPPPAGHAAWTEDALKEAAHNVFVGREKGQRGSARLLLLATTSVNEDVFRSKLWTLVSNDLVSAGRKTERGRLAERLKDVVEGVGDEVTLSHGRVVRAGADEVAVSFDKVVAALAAVPVTVPAWDPMSSRSAPVADRPSLEALVLAALEIAGSAPLSLIVDAVAVRLQIQDLPDLMEIDELDGRAPLADVVDASALDEAALQFLAGLTNAQRLVVPFLEDSATEIAKQTGLKRTRSWQCVRDVQEHIERELRDREDAAAVLRRASEIMMAARQP